MAEKSRVQILDIGGSWGRHYFECKRYFGEGFVASWDVLEMASLVAAVRDILASESGLRFHDSVEVLALEEYTLVFASGALQYVPDPSRLFARLCEAGVPFILLDRAPLTDASRHRLTVQKVPPWIYTARYPAWFLSYSVLEEIWEQHSYRIAVEWAAPEDAPFLDGVRLPYRGLLLQRR